MTKTPEQAEIARLRAEVKALRTVDTIRVALGMRSAAAVLHVADGVVRAHSTDVVLLPTGDLIRTIRETGHDVLRVHAIDPPVLDIR